jgi:general secretion pathway protein G
MILKGYQLKLEEAFMDREASAFRAKSSKNRRKQAGMTLVEIMAVLIIIGLVATMVSVAVLPQIQKARVKATRANGQAIRGAAVMFLSENDNCPTVQDLVDDKILDKQTNTKDEWGNDFAIECDEDGPTVVSAGPDKQMGTDDDI